MTGGVVGALLDVGVPENDAHAAEAVRRGGTLLPVRTDHPAGAERIISGFASVDVDDRRTQYLVSGWQSFDDADRRGAFRRPL